MGLLTLLQRYTASSVAAAAGAPAYKSADNQPLYGPDGLPMAGCCCSTTPLTYRRWSYCSTGELSALWSVDTPVLVEARKVTADNTCYYRNNDSPRSTAPEGQIMGASTLMSSCGDCNCAAPCADLASHCGCEPATYTVTFDGVTALDGCLSTPYIFGDGTEIGGADVNGTYTLLQNPPFLSNPAIRLGNCVWGTTKAGFTFIEHNNPDCTDTFPFEPVDASPTSIAIYLEITSAGWAVYASGFPHAWALFVCRGALDGAACPEGEFANTLTYDPATNPYVNVTVATGGSVTITKGGNPP